MAEFPYLPLWTDSYLADTRHLTVSQHGAYLLLLIEAWRDPDCSLPNDDKRLAVLAAMDPRTWKSNKDVVLAFFSLENGVRYSQKRLRQERDRVNKSRGQKSEAGQASARARAQRMLNGCSTDVQREDQQNGNNPISISKTITKEDIRTPIIPKDLELEIEATKEEETSLRSLGVLKDRICKWFNRRSETAWTDKELKALKTVAKTDSQDLEALEAYYTADSIDPKKDYRRKTIQTLLNNWPGEIDRARNHADGGSDAYTKNGGW